MALVPDTRVTLGDVTLAAFEVPEKIAFGGEQRLAVHKQLGGARVVDALGPDDKDLAWSGRFQGPNATLRAQRLDTLRRQGAAVALGWYNFRYQVVIKSFEADFERLYQSPYRIACLVVADETQPIRTTPAPAVDDLVALDFAQLAETAPGLGEPALASGVAALGSGIATAGPLFEAPQSTLAPLLGQLAGLDGLLATAIAASGGTVAGPGLAGLVAGQNAAAASAMILGQADATGKLAGLVAAQALVGRMAFNLRQASPAASERTVTVAGGTLFQLAAVELGDATQWTRIAALNGLADPMIGGAMRLRLPPTGPST